MPQTHRETVAHIREKFASAHFEDLPGLLAQYEDDERSSVKALVRTAHRRYDREDRERARVLAMYERMYEAAGDSDGVILGVDEVGRGSVAGPLMVAAVALPAEPIVWGVNDSKLLSPARREELAETIAQVAVAIGFGRVEPQEIDACGMAASLRVAMSQAIADAGVEPQRVLIDGLPVHVHPREVAIVHGDATVACIAAASIVAKVTRDALMVEADKRYPGYGFAASKGYASPEHIEAIHRLGLSDYHRATFCKHFL